MAAGHLALAQCAADEHAAAAQIDSAHAVAAELGFAGYERDVLELRAHRAIA